MDARYKVKTVAPVNLNRALTARTDSKAGSQLAQELTGRTISGTRRASQEIYHAVQPPSTARFAPVT
jgi:hypothetical protein